MSDGRRCHRPLTISQAMPPLPCPTLHPSVLARRSPDDPSDVCCLTVPVSPVNEYRMARVAELLCDFTELQYIITSVPVDPDNSEDYYTEGWAAMRQCMLDGQHILDTGADTSVPGASGGSAEQEKAELKQCVSAPTPLSSSTRSHRTQALTAASRCYLDAFARRHEARKIYLRQTAAQRWIQWRDQVLMGGQPHSGVNSQLRSLDQQLRSVRPPFYHPFNVPVPPANTPRTCPSSPTSTSTPSSTHPTPAWAAGRTRTRACGPSSGGSGPVGVRGWCIPRCRPVATCQQQQQQH